MEKEANTTRGNKGPGQPTQPPKVGDKGRQRPREVDTTTKTKVALRTPRVNSLGKNLNSLQSWVLEIVFPLGVAVHPWHLSSICPSWTSCSSSFACPLWAKVLNFKLILVLIFSSLCFHNSLLACCLALGGQDGGSLLLCGCCPKHLSLYSYLVVTCLLVSFLRMPVELNFDLLGFDRFPRISCFGCTDEAIRIVANWMPSSLSTRETTRENATALNCLRTQVWICQSLPWRTDWSFKHSIVECDRVNEHVYPFSALWMAYHLSPCRALRLNRAKCQHRAHGRPKVRSPWLGWKWRAVRWVSTFNYMVSIDELPRSSASSRWGFVTFELWIQGPQFTACADQNWTAYLGSKRLTQTRFFLSRMAIATLHR